MKTITTYQIIVQELGAMIREELVDLKVVSILKTIMIIITRRVIIQDAATTRMIIMTITYQVIIQEVGGARVEKSVELRVVSILVIMTMQPSMGAGRIPLLSLRGAGRFLAYLRRVAGRFPVPSNTVARGQINKPITRWNRTSAERESMERESVERETMN
jgi:hypothetical protein